MMEFYFSYLWQSQWFTYHLAVLWSRHYQEEIHQEILQEHRRTRPQELHRTRPQELRQTRHRGVYVHGDDDDDGDDGHDVEVFQMHFPPVRQPPVIVKWSKRTKYSFSINL